MMIRDALDKEIIELHEREARAFPREALFDGNGQSRIYPEARDMSAVDLRETASGLELRVLGLVGFLPLTPTLSLNLKPKFPLSNLWHMLRVADSSCEILLPALRGYVNADSAAPNQVLIRSFCFYLKSILAHGIAKGYLHEEYSGYFKPKLNFGKTVSRYLSRGNDIDIVSDVHNFSYRLISNGYLKSACLDFLNITPNSAAFSEERLLLLDALNALDRVPRLTLDQSYKNSFSQVPSWLLSGYTGALEAYSILLGHKGIGFTFSPYGSPLPSFIFSLDGIFEKYIRNSLREFFSADKISVQDGNPSKNHGALFVDTKKYPVKPDLIFRKKKDILCIGEIKYKPKIDESDRYQLISHVMAFRSPIGIWISPSKTSETIMEYVGKTSSGAKFYHCMISLSKDLESSSKEMTLLVRNLIS